MNRDWDTTGVSVNSALNLRKMFFFWFVYMLNCVTLRWPQMTRMAPPPTWYFRPRKIIARQGLSRMRCMARLRAVCCLYSARPSLFSVSFYCLVSKSFFANSTSNRSARARAAPPGSCRTARAAFWDTDSYFFRSNSATRTPTNHLQILPAPLRERGPLHLYWIIIKKMENYF